MAQKKVYDKEFKIQAVKLGREIGFSKATKELGVNTDTLYGWNKRAKDAMRIRERMICTWFLAGLPTGG